MSAEDKFLLLSNIDDIRAASDEVYVGKVTGKGLSTEDYTTDEKTKLAGIDEGADENAIEVVRSTAPRSQSRTRWSTSSSRRAAPTAPSR